MKRVLELFPAGVARRCVVWVAAFGLVPLLGLRAADPVALDRLSDRPRGNLSLRQEIEHAIGKGITWLGAQAHPGGGWSDTNHPALTALALVACLGEPSGQLKAAPPPYVRNGFAFLRRAVRPDGGIYRTNLANYNTSLAVMAFVALGDPADEPLVRRARRFIAGQQNDFGEKGISDHPLDGGIGYGGSRAHADMSNTLAALEALYHSREMGRDRPGDELGELRWNNVIGFIERCQNLPSHNPESWASDDAQNRGGFVYYPGYSMAGEVDLPAGRKALRSYGSISYAGLLSYIYADVGRDDPRVRAVLDWLRRNYTLEENPGMGEQGLYYYFHTMAKALSVYGAETLELEGGKRVLWTEDLARKLINLQHQDGHWVNETGRWWEKDPVLVTGYALIALEYVVRRFNH